jgi:DTW domain-containing protein YfiP
MFPDFPDYTEEEGTFVLYPSEGALSFEDINIPVKRVIVLDSQWHKCFSMTSDERISNLPRVKIRNYSTTFWRYQKKGPDHLATIEAIYYFYREYHLSQHGTYNGEYDGW